MTATNKASAALRLINLAQHSFQGCKTHGCGCSSSHGAGHSAFDIQSAARSIASQGRSRTYATPVSGSGPKVEADYAFEVSAAQLRFGDGVTKEVGLDFKNMKATKVGVYTDSTVAKLLPMKTAIQSLESAGIRYEVFKDCKVEPSQESWEKAIRFARERDFSHFLAVGGGSVIDTCKVANLYTCYPDAPLLEFVNAPIGKGSTISKTLKPLIAVPTTAGTGSETTGTAIFDYTPLQAKTGIANRALRPSLGIVDPLNTDSCPTAVHISSGLDVLFHSLESYTAIPYYERTPRPSNPLQRPAYQGRNPISDVFSLWALRTTVKYLPRVARDPTDKEAKSQMLLASTFAGIGFGNAGVHLCHGFSYPISGLNKKIAKYKHLGYEVEDPLIPHGLSVAITGPSVFRFTAPSSPERHREASDIFSPLTDAEKRLPDSEIGDLIHDRIASFLSELGLPRGLSRLGYNHSHLPEMVVGTLPQKRVLDLAPGDLGEESLHKILEGAMSF
ncbi:uncharacterized protein MELLADRAFT_44184 [Melampsora larici-populina 98AG31]|uniref:hydroxyacid-oxoacid transhydrogenase n=1 Tax=Melampsora larici-populina (strain 98AG31 / pathotype 3-4-7) TaxID=747676 RepID=F4RSX8_MELLP|nr:uncharacterized protein MELLADRAFT_44184 [Melampsora larici-populina 98AG31]EGG04526.1 hypothetical protein MELLADRAFT_44184 [Melampsora larici-populina 98AG31]